MTDIDAPDLLIIGTATRDLLADGAWRLGGSVAFGALAASRLGLRPAIVTSAPADVLAALAAAVPGIPVAAVKAAEATTFENLYLEGGRRRQYLRGRAATLDLDAVPAGWRAAPLVLLAPLARDVDPALAAAFPGAQVAAAPQGWLRRWDATGLVHAGPWPEAERVLPRLSAVVLSLDDLPAAGAAGAGADAEAVLAAWARLTPLVVVTRGAEGADLLAGERRARFPAYAAREVDPTGAGDVFTVAFLCHLRETGDPHRAVDFANCTASFAVEREGMGGIPTRAQVEVRLRAGPGPAPEA